MDPNTPHLAVGTELGYGKYRIVRFIGAGGFGCTYEAEFVPMGSRVAIKEFFVSSCCNREASGAVSVGIVSQTALVSKLEDKFRTEAKRLFKMQHPNIVRVSDIVQENGTSYYVMDYIEGRSLQSIINHEGPLSEARALRYIGQVMDALEYVHGKNMLHLDIKPDNIMVNAETDQAILIDFGVSKQYDEVDGHNTSTIMGQTPGFAPLEQAGNRVKQFTPATDIYALGATLYCALTGMIPPSSADLSSETAILDPLPGGISSSTREAIALMMQPGVGKRPQTVSAARALLKMENGKLKMENETESIGNKKDTKTKVGSRPVATDANATVPAGNETKLTSPSNPKSKKWLWAAVVAVVVIAVCAAIFFTQSENAISGTYNGYEWVDMGTGVKWATKNVGATSSSDYGSYFAWGEINPASNNDYSEENCSLYVDSSIGSIAGNSAYDAARANWGGNWRMPTKKEWEELIDNCTWTWTGKGYEVKSNATGNTIYLPAAGGRYGTSLYGAGEYGRYWSATPSSDSLWAWRLYFDSGDKSMNDYYRYFGRSVRPVLE